MGEGRIARYQRPAVITVAVAALLISGQTVIGQLSGPKIFGPGASEISVAPGERFSVRLPDDPADGYHWAIAEPRPDPAVVAVTGDRFREGGPPPEDPEGARYLDFAARRTGRTDLRLLHCRRCGPGTAGETGARSVNFRITVGPS